MISTVAAHLAPVIAKEVGTRISPIGSAYRDQLKEDVEKWRTGQLGLSDAEKQQMTAGALQNIQATTRGQEAQLRRDASATAGTGRSGAAQQAMANLQMAQTGAAAQAAGQTEQLSQQVAQQREARVVGQAERQLDRIRQDWAQAGAAVEKSHDQIVDTVTMLVTGKSAGAADAAGYSGVDPAAVSVT